MLITCVENILYFGNLQCCRMPDTHNYAIAHACKEPCHRNAVGYVQKSLNKDHPHYLSYEKNNHLYLNLIDPPVPLFKLESFKIFLNFAKRIKDENKPLLIHCNQGQSRAPSLALLHMAKILKHLPNTNFTAARLAFEEKFSYAPNTGITAFLNENWDNLNDYSSISSSTTTPEVSISSES